MPDWRKYVRDHLELPEVETLDDCEIVEEIAGQLEDLYLAALAKGASEEAARQAALQGIGDWKGLASGIVTSRPLRPAPMHRFSAGTDRLRSRGPLWAFLADIGQDSRFAMRSFRRRPLFTLVAVLTLGLGIGAATASFSVVDGVLLRDLQFGKPDRLISIWQAFPTWQGSGNPDQGRLWDRIQYTFQDYLDLKANSRQLEEVALFAGWGQATLTGQEAPEKLSIGLASANLFPLLGVPPQLGRVFIAGEDAAVPGQAARVAVISHELWQGRFGSAPDIVGQGIRLDGRLYTVVGVLPPGFRLPSVIVTDVIAGRLDQGLRDLWLPLGQPGVDLLGEGNSFEVVARPVPGATLDQIRQEALALLPPNPNGPEREIRAASLKEVFTQGYSQPLWLLLAASGMLLLIACTNVATLQLGEAVGRLRELSTRAALGAGRMRVVSQLLTESALLGLLGAVAGALFAWGGTQLLVGLAPPIPRLEEIQMSFRVFLFAAGTGLLTGLLFGLAPGLLVSRKSISSLLSGRGSTDNRGNRWFQGAAVSLQIALTAVLLVSGGLFLRSLYQLGNAEPGFNPGHLAVLRVDVPGTTEEATRYFEEVIRRLRELRGVESVSGSYGLPFPGGAPINGIQVPGPDGDQGFTARRRTVWTDYHETLEIPLIAGRTFTEFDRADTPRVMVVSQSLAERFLPPSPVGSSVRFWGQQWSIVGIVGDVRHTSLSREGEPTFYVPFSQAPRTNLSLVLRTRGEPSGILESARQVLGAVNAEVPIEEATTMPDLLSLASANDRYRALLLLVFGACAAFLGSVGLFGITARAVIQRTREMGIRLALGAKESQLMALVVRRTLILGVAGISAGLFLALWTSRFLRNFLYQVSPHDVLTFIGVGLLMLVVCLGAAYLPARRTLRLVPAQVLRDE